MHVLDSLSARFLQYKELAERALAQLSDAQFAAPAPEGQNSISVILRHLHGNMLSRFSNFLTEDGEKPWRQRDAEFEHGDADRAQLMSEWNAGWACLFDAIRTMNDAQLDDKIYVRGEAMSAFDALLRQLAHYAYHVGQIVTLSRQRAETWKSLSISRGESAQFTASLRAKTQRSGGA